jgi:hypothetical protein
MDQILSKRIRTKYDFSRSPEIAVHLRCSFEFLFVCNLLIYLDTDIELF